MLMRELATVVALVFACAVAQPAAAWRYGTPAGGGGGSSPNVIPGASQPNTNPTLVTYNTIAPVSHGSSGDYGYTIRGWARWDDVPLVEVGQSGVAGSRQIGLIAVHTPNNAEKAAGLATDITSVDVRCDGGSWFTITAPSTNANASGVADWNFTVNSANFADGLHKCDAVAHPATGPDIIMEGPLEATTHDTVPSNTAVAINNGSSSAGNILNVSGTMENQGGSTGSGALGVGMSVSGMGVAPDTFIDGSSTVNATSCVAQTGSNCTGAGGTGKYHVGVSQLVASTTATFNIERSFYFITDYGGGAAGGGLGRGTHIIYASQSGNEGNTGADAAHPVVGTATARGKIYTNDATGHGKWGGIVCLMGGGTWANDTGTGTDPTLTLGFLKYQSANTAPCVNAGDPGGATMKFSETGDDIYASFTFARVWYKNIKTAAQSGCNSGSCYPGSSDNGKATQLVAEGVTNTTNDWQDGGLLGNSAYACFDSTAYYGNDGGCNQAQIVRNSTLKYFKADGLHGVALALNNTIDGGGAVFAWTTGSSTAGSPVITGVTVQGGQALSTLFPAGNVINVWDGSNVPGFCFPGSSSTTNPTVVSTTSNTITLDMNATSTCTGSYLGDSSGVHSDMVQNQQDWLTADIILIGNSFGQTFPAFQQGFFQEQQGVSGIYLDSNSWKNLPADTNDSIIEVSGGNEHVIYHANVWTGGNIRQDTYGDSNDETFVGDQCSPGKTFTGALTNIRRLAAGSNACYTTTTP